MLDLVGFDNVSSEQRVLEKEAKQEEKRKKDEEEYWNQYESLYEFENEKDCR